MPKGKYNLMILPNTLASFGGGEHLAFEMAHRLSKDFNVTIVNPVSRIDLVREEKGKLLKDHGISESQVIDVECRGIKMKAFGTEDFILMIPTSKGKRRFEEAIRESDSVYCITNNPFLVDYAAKTSRKHGTKFVFAIQNRIFASYFENNSSIKDKIGTALYRRILKKIRYFHALNSFDAGLVRENLPGAKAYVIPGFTSFGNSRIRVGKKEFVALWVGRLPKYQKGVDLLCDVVENTLKKENGIKFRIAGGGGDGEPLVRKLAQKYRRNVEWLGFVSYGTVKRQYGNSDLLLFTARGDELRYFPLVFLEGQSFGLPLVSFWGNSYDEIVDSSSGILVKDFDVGRFADAVIHYYRLWKEDKGKYLKLKGEVSDTTRRRYSDSTVMPKMAKMLKPD